MYIKTKKRMYVCKNMREKRVYVCKICSVLD